MRKKCAILQSNYIPWKGVFDMINQVDTFVFLEDVDFTIRDWRTRNRIKTANGAMWLSVPVKKPPRGTKIYEIETCQDTNWQLKHYKTIYNTYKKAPYFTNYHGIIEEIYLSQKWSNLSEFNIYVTKLLTKALNINTTFLNSKELKTNGHKDDKLIEICKKVGANFYLSGPTAKNYISHEKFLHAGIELAYMDYDHYPEYKQLYGKFDHYVSVLDVLFSCGKNSIDFIAMNKFKVE